MDYFVYRRAGFLADRVAAAAARLHRVTVGNILILEGVDNGVGTKKRKGFSAATAGGAAGGAAGGQGGGGEGGGWCTTSDLGSLVRVKHTESCAAAAAAALHAAKALAQSAEAAVAELEASAPGFLSTR